MITRSTLSWATVQLRNRSSLSCLLKPGHSVPRLFPSTSASSFGRHGQAGPCLNKYLHGTDANELSLRVEEGEVARICMSYRFIAILSVVYAGEQLQFRNQVASSRERCEQCKILTIFDNSVDLLAVLCWKGLRRCAIMQSLHVLSKSLEPIVH